MGQRGRGKTVTERVGFMRLGLPLSEKQIPQVIENAESGDQSKEHLERVVMRPRQVRYQAALRPDILCFFDFKPLPEIPTAHGSPTRLKNAPTVTKPISWGGPRS